MSNLHLRRPVGCFSSLRPANEGSTMRGQGSVVGIWSVAIWSLVRVFGAATESRQLSFAGPRPSGKVRSFAPQTDMVATTGKFATLPWCCRSVTPSGGNTRVPIHWFSRPTQPLLAAEPMHPPAHSPTAFGGRCRAAVPALSGANIGSGAGSGVGFCAGLRLTPPRAKGALFKIFRP